MRASPIPLPSGVNINRAAPASLETLVNMYSERVGGNVVVHSDHGLARWLNFPNGVRGLNTIRELIWLVSGTQLVTINQSGFVAPIGTIEGTGDCQIEGDENEVVILSGGESWRVFNGVVTKITDPEYQRASSLAFLNGSAIWSVANSYRFFYSASPDDASDIQGLDFASAEKASDNLVRIVKWRNDLLMFGTSSVEAWYDVGAEGYVPRDDMQMGIGLAGKYAVTNDADVMMWLANDGTVRSLDGSSAVRRSNTAIERIIDGWGDLSPTKAFQWVFEGHLFTAFVHPNGCVRHDMTTNEWSVKKSDAIQSWKVNNCIRVWGQAIFVADNGWLLKVDDVDRRENGENVTALCRTPTMTADGGFVRIHRVEMDFDTGLSPVSVDFPVNLGWSDNGQSIDASETLSLGVGGDLGQTIEVWRGGQTRRRWWEFSTSFPRRFSFLAMRVFADRGLR
jgi:hypothetical protein